MLFATALLLATAPVAATRSEPLDPSGKWVVAGDDGLCVLSRAYGEGADRIELGIRPLGSEERTEIVILGGGDHGGTRSGKAEVAIGDATPIATSYGSYVLGTPGRRVTTLTVDQDIRYPLANAATMTVRAGSIVASVRLVTIGPALKVLARCHDLMLERWGVDVAAYHAETVHPRIVNASVYGPEEYPQAALRMHAQGRTVALLAITADGHVGGCKVVTSSANAALDEATCRVALHRLRFTGAQGADGRPAPSSFVLPVRWSLPFD